MDAVSGRLGAGLGGAVVGALALQLIGQAAQHAEAHEGARAHRPIIQPAHTAAHSHEVYFLHRDNGLTRLQASAII